MAENTRTPLQKFSMGEPLAEFNTKLNALVDDANAQAATVQQHGNVLQEYNDQVLNKLNRKPYFFNVTSEMVACSYLKPGDAAFVIGAANVADGNLKFYRLTVDPTKTPDGSEIVAITGSTVDGGGTLIAIHSAESQETELRNLINGLTTDMTNLASRIEIKDVTIPSTASWSATKQHDGKARNYYKLPIEGFTANTKAIAYFSPSWYAEAELEDVREILGKILDGDTTAGGIEFFATENINMGGHALHFVVFVFFNVIPNN